MGEHGVPAINENGGPWMDKQDKNGVPAKAVRAGATAAGSVEPRQPRYLRRALERWVGGIDRGDCEETEGQLGTLGCG